MGNSFVSKLKIATVAFTSTIKYTKSFTSTIIRSVHFTSIATGIYQSISWFIKVEVKPVAINIISMSFIKKLFLTATIPPVLMSAILLFKKPLNITLIAPSTLITFNRIFMTKKVAITVVLNSSISIRDKMKAILTGITLTSPKVSVQADAKRRVYAMLSDYDALYLSDMDNVYLQDLDYTTI
jgi:hypothetical protein